LPSAIRYVRFTSIPAGCFAQNSGHTRRRGD
jgi:hypothetical protein